MDQKLFNYFADNHGLTLLDSELADIRQVVAQDMEVTIRNNHDLLIEQEAEIGRYRKQLAEAERLVEWMVEHEIHIERDSYLSGERTNIYYDTTEIFCEPGDEIKTLRELAGLEQE